MQEYFDLLTETGEYIGKTEKREVCHEKGLWHKAVSLFIINSKNQVLLQKRSANKKMWPNTWDITVGGHVLSGEFGFEAVIREAYEELGVELCENDITFIGSVVSSNKNSNREDNHFNEYYIANKDVDEKKLKLQEQEVSDIKWVDKEEIIKRVKNNYDGITEKQGCWEYLIKYYEWTDSKK